MVRNQLPTATELGEMETCWGLFQLAPVKVRALGLMAARVWLGFQAAEGDTTLT